MKLTNCILVLLFLLPFAAFAQPRYSPEVRSKKEMQWLQDSVHINADQANKINGISLTYQQQMDKAAELPDKIKKQDKLSKKKDAALKKILTKDQYQRYYKREAMIRKQDRIIYKGHQPL